MLVLCDKGPEGGDRRSRSRSRSRLGSSGVRLLVLLLVVVVQAVVVVMVVGVGVGVVGVAVAARAMTEVVVVGMDAGADALAVSGVSAMASVFVRACGLCAAGPSSLAGRSLACSLAHSLTTLSLVPIPSSPRPCSLACVALASTTSLVPCFAGLCVAFRSVLLVAPPPQFSTCRPRSWLPWSGRIACCGSPYFSMVISGVGRLPLLARAFCARKNRQGAVG